ncbi:MAG: hypothetical protein AB1486_28170 [Planctomycetota bacterium]
MQSKGIKLFDALCAALLERGRPMLLEEIVERLERAGAVAETGDLGFSLQKAWHGQEPIYRDSSGRFGINLSAPDLKWRVDRWERARAPSVSAEPPPLPVRGDDEPLSTEEVDAALRDRAPGTVSPQRLAAAILDSHGAMLGLDEINDALKGLSRSHRRIEAEALRRGKEPLVECDSSGLWKLASNGAPPQPVSHQLSAISWSGPRRRRGRCGVDFRRLETLDSTTPTSPLQGL